MLIACGSGGGGAAVHLVSHYICDFGFECSCSARRAGISSSNSPISKSELWACGECPNEHPSAKTRGAGELTIESASS